MPLSPHLSHIHRHHPHWHKHASPHQRQQLKQRILASYRASRTVAQALAPVQPIDSYCRPLLEAALARWFPDTTLPSLDTAVLWNYAENRDMPWLEAALQNFDEGTRVKLYGSADDAQPLALDSAVFVSGVRNLDLGQRYRYHLADHIDTDALRTLLREQDRAALAAELSLAHMQGHLDTQGVALGEAALAGERRPMVDGQQRTLQCSFLTLFDIPLDGPLLLRLQPGNSSEPCILYLPGHPTRPLRQYSSVKALGQALTEALWQENERRIFSRYVNQAQQPEFATKLHGLLLPSYPYATLLADTPVREKGAPSNWLNQLFPAPTDLWQQTLDKNARLPLGFTAWQGDCFADRARVQVERKLIDAACVAVPVAQRDAAALLASVQAWLGVGLSVLNVAGLFVPGLGELMMVIGGAQLVDEFLEGVHAANEGDAEAAIEQLLDVLENLAQVAVLGAAASIGETQGPLHEWHRVARDGRQRLWQGDLSPFARPEPWPAGTPAAADGLHDWQHERWLHHEGKALPLQPMEKGRWRLAKTRGQQYQPALLQNGQGAWLLPHESPLSWDSAQLLRRVGPVTQGLADETMEQALRCSGYDAASVRKALADHEPLPALLVDSFQALGAKTPEVAALPGSELLARDFPSLSPRACNEIIARARPADLARLRSTGKLPLQMAETARLYVREARINRALGSFQQAGADRDAMAIGALAELPGWRGEIRLELRENGQLRHAAGTEGKPLKTVIREAGRYQPRDERDQVLASAGDLFQAILHALPDSERVALGLQIHDSKGLREALFAVLARDRQRAAGYLGMATVRPMYRLPTRLPGSYRIGYRLSGRGSGWLTEDQLFDQLFPASEQGDRELLRGILRNEAGPRPGAFTRLLERLRREYRQLDETLQRWVHDPDNVQQGFFEQRRVRRGLMADRIRQAWRRENAPDTIADIDNVILRIHGQYLDELPTLPVQLPYVRHLAVHGLDEVPAGDLNLFLRAFPQVRHLDLRDNLLPDLPAVLGELQQVETLDLAGNALNLENQNQLHILGRLGRLRYLCLDQSLEALSPGTLQQLARLPQLEVFQAALNDLELGAEHFQALQRWPALRELYLGQNQVELDQAGRTALAGLNRLRRLSLYENPLDLAPDLTGWTQLEWLDLEYTGIGEWPPGLQGLMEQRPLVLRRVEMNRNALVDAPDLRDSAFAEAVREGNEDMVYAFDDNPYTPEALQRLNDAGLTTPAQGDAPPQWSAGWPEPLLDHIANTYADPQWRPLYELLERLPDTRDFESHPQAFRLRMQRVVQALAADGQPEGDGGWGQAQVLEQIIDLLNDATTACVDQASLLFQQVETDVTVWQAVSHAGPGLADEQVAVDSATSLLRQQELDAQVGEIYNARVARRRALNEAQEQADRDAAPALHAGDDISDADLTDATYPLDEVEMALHARIHLRQTLRLPPQPEEIAFDYLARLSEETLARLAVDVTVALNDQRLADWALEQRFWSAWVRRLRPQAFEALAEQWGGASEYFDSLGEAATPGAYAGATVPLGYVEALEGEFGEVPWRIGGVLQRIELVSGLYPNQGVIYQRAAELLLESRKAAEAALLRRLTEEMIQAPQ